MNERTIVDAENISPDKVLMNENRDDDKYKEQHPFYLLVILLIVMGIAANFIPSGAYERIVEDGRTIIDPASFHYVDKLFISIDGFFLSFYDGFVEASGLMAMVLFVGGAFGVVKSIGLLEAAIKLLANAASKLHFIPMSFVLMASFGSLVSFTGMYELSIVLVPLIVPLYLRMGYDVITGTAVVLVAACAGLGSGMTNPFFTAIAQNIAELPLYSGILYRFFVFASLLTIGVVFVYLYARRIKSDPQASFVYGIPVKYSSVESADFQMTAGLKRATVAFLVSFGFLIYGSIFLQFSFAQMSATFIALAAFVGLAYGASLNRICHMFSNGMTDMMVAALVIFIARAVLVIMDKTQVVDSVIHFLVKLIGDTGNSLGAILVFISQTAINFFIPSGSGQATITMPIIIPVADVMGLNRQVAILASQMGDGMSNFIFPTNGALIAILSIAGIPYRKWFRFFAPLFLLYIFATGVLLFTAVSIDLGPF